MFRKIIFVALLPLLLFQNSCSSSYSFTGASISPEVETVSIAFFENIASLTPPNESQLFTEALRDIFLSQTNLTLVKSDGHLHFEGQIVNYTTNPVAIQANEEAALTRLSISVKVIFINEMDPSKNFESVFTRYEDFESTRDLSQVENDLLQTINEQLVQDIFNQSVTNW